MKAFQDYYPENLAHCYGCGRTHNSAVSYTHLTLPTSDLV